MNTLSLVPMVLHIHWRRTLTPPTCYTNNVSMMLPVLESVISLYEWGEGESHVELVRIGMWPRLLHRQDSIAAQLQVLLIVYVVMVHNGRMESALHSLETYTFSFICMVWRELTLGSTCSSFSFSDFFLAVVVSWKVNIHASKLYMHPNSTHTRKMHSTYDSLRCRHTHKKAEQLLCISQHF